MAQFDGADDAGLLSSADLIPWDGDFTQTFIVRAADEQFSASGLNSLFGWIDDAQEVAAIQYLGGNHPAAGQLQATDSRLHHVDTNAHQ